MIGVFGYLMSLVLSWLGLPGHGRRISFRILHVFESATGWSVAKTSGSIARRSSVS
jgi:hypothetical protein